MNSIYTMTITDAAKKRGIHINVLDPQLPIFSLSYGEKTIRCYNGLTDNVGAATFHLANDKGASNRFLREQGFPVPEQKVFTTFSDALTFMQAHRSIVVKPVSQWGGRGVSTHVSDSKTLRAALSFAQRYCDDLVLEECVSGIDWRLIFVDGKFTCAIQRDPAAVEGNGIDTLKSLIMKKNKEMRVIDKSNSIPLDNETIRCIEDAGLTYNSIPPKGVKIIVRRTSNYHTGGVVTIVTELIPQNLIGVGEKISKILNIPLLGVDMLVDNPDNNFKIIELSPDMAISPPEGSIVVEAFLDCLFPATKKVERESEKILQII